MHPCAFYLNRQILSRIGLKKSYVIGALIASLTIINVAFWPFYNAPILFFCGCCYGIGSGLYWSNRNVLEYIETKNSNRQYFYSLIYAIGWIADIIVPFVCGWFVSAFSTDVSKAHIAYFILFGISFLLMVTCAYWIYRTKFKTIWLSKNLVSFKFKLNNRRLISISIGICEGIGFLGPLLTLYYFKSEIAMGSLVSLSALATALSMYVYGIYNVNQNNYKGLLISSALFTITALLLAIRHTVAPVILFVIFSDIFVSFFGLIAQPILFHLIENEDLINDFKHTYSYIIDNELYLNVGRIMSIMFLLIITVIFSDKSALLYCPLFIGIAQFAIAFRVKAIQGSIFINPIT